MAGIFRAYDIRGIYGDTLTDEVATEVARAFGTFLKPKMVVVGRDMRPHSEPIFQAVYKGLAMQGVDVVDIGLCSTPMLYCANGVLGADGSIMITASHNPPEWNGLKLCREQAIPLSGNTGIDRIEHIFLSKSFDPPPLRKSTVRQYNIEEEYRRRVQGLTPVTQPVRIAADFANAMGIYEARALEGLFLIDRLFDTLDGSQPNHEANPLKAETLAVLQQKVRSGSYDFGVAFDGDADRVGFIDEKGNIVPMDMITALISRQTLQKEKGIILYDLRSSWAVREVIEESGGTPLVCRVGHAFIKQQMRDSNAMFAGELSGHYYFRENFNAESAAMAVLSVAAMVSRAGAPLSELVRPIQRYHSSGEINSRVKNVEKILTNVRDRYKDGTITELDGISIEFNDWWFNVRPSNTEPLIRLNLEAKTKELMEMKREEILKIIRK